MIDVMLLFWGRLVEDPTTYDNVLDTTKDCWGDVDGWCDENCNIIDD